MKSPCCNAECWDIDCDTCETGGETTDGCMCTDCDGLGYISGWVECSVCGEQTEVE